MNFKHKKSLIACALALMPACRDAPKKTTASQTAWYPVLGTCAQSQDKPCYLTDGATGLIWSHTQDEPLAQADASARCASFHMRLPTFREYAIAARNGMLDLERAFPEFGEHGSLLWTAAPNTYIIFTKSTAEARTGRAPAQFKCVAGETVPVVTPIPHGAAPAEPSADSCAVHDTLEACGTRSACVWTYDGCESVAPREDAREVNPLACKDLTNETTCRNTNDHLDCEWLIGGDQRGFCEKAVPRIPSTPGA